MVHRGGPARSGRPGGDAGVLVVGAGPTGLALACALFGNGVACRVIDAAPARGDRSKGIAIWPRTLEVLADLGVVEPVVERGLALREGTVWSRGRRVAGFDLGTVASRYPFGLVLPQYETESILEARLGELGGRVERPVEFLDAGTGSATGRVRLRAGGQVHPAEVDWLVGCDGAGSAVRRASGIGMPQRLEREGWILADVELETTLAPTGVHYFLSEHGVLHMVPVRPDGARGRWRLTLNVGRVRPDPSRWTLERVAEAAARRAAVPVRVAAVDWVSGFRVRQGLARRFRRGPVLLAGDSAHVHSPAGAQGINAGIQDAVNLGWKLARVATGRAPDSLLDTYEAERRPAARTVVRATDRATRMGTLRGRRVTAVRDRLWSWADRGGLIDRRLTPALAGLDQRYPGGPLTAARGPLRRLGDRVTATVRVLRPAPPGPGARLPDVALGDGRWLWEVLPPDRSTVLVLAGPGSRPTAPVPDLPPGTPRILVAAAGPPVVRAGPGPAGWQTLPDPAARVRRALRAGAGTVVVVRPDRHIAVCCDLTGIQGIREYFTTVEGEGTCPEPAT